MAAMVVAHVPVFPAPGWCRHSSGWWAFSEVPPAMPCAAAIVSVAPCLAQVAVVAPRACCAAFLRGVSPSGGGGEGCFCHLLRDPLLLVFPVNTARLGALLPTCAAANANASAAAIVEATTLFADTCRGHYRGGDASGLGQEGGEEQVREWWGPAPAPAPEPDPMRRRDDVTAADVAPPQSAPMPTG
ncbi:uncharacterized protein LOC127781124 [Oryza glaberrima]|uniref:uncharacterized protein LOC127781124 n=1 Tax=Oryza glaberrima TaxID=4538 RepID=UPI00224C596F|nr:uncharacterized protein LOC127781124 [Oryza glaberrima]